MTIALAPLAISVIGGFFLFNHGVVQIFQNVATRHQEQIVPLQQLRLMLWDTLAPAVEFVDEGSGARRAQYSAISAQIEEGFSGLHQHLADEPEARTLVWRARNDWIAADQIASDLFSSARAPGNASSEARVERFNREIAAASDNLGAAYSQLNFKIGADYSLALQFYERAIWLSGLAAVASFIAVICGVFIISRIISASVDRLVDGATRFADGDRTHRIDVQVPPELKRVASEFNRMIARIQESESALADLARRDGLTHLLNRRAFDEALREMYARIERGGEPGALITIDIDHFKTINDTYGHTGGDEVLRALARMITSDVRPFDHVFRTGGEEFAVLLPGARMETARQTAERLRADIAAASIHVDKAEIAVTISLGVAKACLALQPGELIEAADAALYRAKTRGRNRVAVIDEFGFHDETQSQDAQTRLRSIA